MKKRINLVIVSALCAIGALAADTAADTAHKLFMEGMYEEAAPMLRDILQDDPKNGRCSFMLGVIEVQGGDYELGKQLLQQAIKSGYREASLVMADVRLKEYDLDNARTNIDRYAKGAKTDDDKETVRMLNERLDRTERMLQRVERVVILDSINVDSETFFKAYTLPASSGSLHDASILPENTAAAQGTIVYQPEDGHMMIWAAPLSSDDDTYRLVGSNRLTDGSWEAPSPLKGEFNDGGDANYPYLMPDGSTIYFANDGENSLGGYDIFIARDNGDGFLQPQNLGMPFNSPYDDYMLVIDEENGIGWWASDRNCIPGKTTIYIYKVSDMRQNYDPDTPNLAALALIRSIRDTWGENDYSATLEEITSSINNEGAQALRPLFSLTVPGKGVYRNFEDFNSDAAADAMRAYLQAVERQSELERLIADKRSAYARGDKSGASHLRQLERQLLDSREKTLKARNQVIKLENRYK